MDTGRAFLINLMDALSRGRSVTCSDASRAVGLVDSIQLDVSLLWVS